MPRVLLVALPKKDETKIKKIFDTVNVTCESTASLDAAIEKIPNDPPALVLLENPDRVEALYSLKDTLRAYAPATPFVVTLPKSDMPVAIESLRAGAFDCIARPYSELDVLAASKRASLKNGRALFSNKIEPKRRRFGPFAISLLAGLLLTSLFFKKTHGPPPKTINLSSAHLAGLQWEGRRLWVADWLESTVTCYEAKTGFFQRSRGLVTSSLYHMQDGQPILICNTPETLITVGADLMIRSQQRSVGLPALQARPAPGTNPSGLAWDGEYLWSVDAQSNLLYRHGTDLRVMEVVKSIVPQPSGLAWDGSSLWVLGGTPLQMARLSLASTGAQWTGPYDVPNLLATGVAPSGAAMGFERLWIVSGGDPNMVSKPLREITARLESWNRTVPPREKK